MLRLKWMIVFSSQSKIYTILLLQPVPYKWTKHPQWLAKINVYNNYNLTSCFIFLVIFMTHSIQLHGSSVHKFIWNTFMDNFVSLIQFIIFMLLNCGIKPWDILRCNKIKPSPFCPNNHSFKRWFMKNVHYFFLTLSLI